MNGEALKPLAHFPLLPTHSRMSLAIHQSLLQAKSDLADLQRRISVGDDTPKVRSLVNGVKKQIAILEKRYADEQASQKQKAAAEVKPQRREAPRKEREERPKKPLFEDMDLTCCDCTNCFVFTGKDQAFFTKNDWKAPTRCPECREARKNKKPAGKTIVCGECGVGFFFSEAKQKKFAEMKWEDPKWCHPCKIARKAKWQAEQAAAAAAGAGAGADAAIAEAESEVLAEETA